MNRFEVPRSGFKRMVALLVGICVLPGGLAAAEGPRNFLLITVDDMNWDSIGAFGCPIPEITPHIDRLAAEGMRFAHSHVTIAICQPTRAVWMTGRYPHRSGALGFDPIDRGVPTLLEQFKANGYRTGILGKVTHVVPTRRAHWDMAHDAGELQQGRNPEAYYARALEFLQQAKSSGAPFFLMANAHDPHRPFAGSLQQRQRENRPRRNAKGNNAKRGKGNDFPETAVRYRPEDVPLPAFLPDLPDIRQELAEYFTSVHRADETVGAVLRALDEAGLAETTLVMFLSDHGMPLPFAKTNCYYHSTRTPWIVRWPGVVQAGSVDREHFVSGIDLAPTVLDALGLPPLEGVDGRSFVPVLRGERQEGRERVFTHINRIASKRSYPMRSVQDRRYGYIFNAWSDGETLFRNESQNGLTMKAMQAAAKNNAQVAERVRLFLHRVPEELYDYEHDPSALRNLAHEPEHAERLAEYRRALLEQMAATDDPVEGAFREYLANAGGREQPAGIPDAPRKINRIELPLPAELPAGLETILPVRMVGLPKESAESPFAQPLVFDVSCDDPRLAVGLAQREKDSPWLWLPVGARQAVSGTAVCEAAARLQEPQAGVQARLESDGILVTDHGRKVLWYQTAPKSEGKYTRANYIHPLWGLDGAELTEEFPSDHRHHHGVFWAWHQLWVGETRAGDPWTTEDFVVQVTKREIVDEGPVFATVRVEGDWLSKHVTDESGERVPIVREVTQVRVFHAGENSQSIDLETRLTAAVPGVRLGGSEDVKGYSGFTVRIRPPHDLQIQDAGGLLSEDGMHRQSAWSETFGSFAGTDGPKSSLAILTHPRLPEFPPKWLLRHYGMQNVLWPGREPVDLGPEKPLVLKHRLLLQRSGDREADSSRPVPVHQRIYAAAP